MRCIGKCTSKRVVRDPNFSDAELPEAHKASRCHSLWRWCRRETSKSISKRRTVFTKVSSWLRAERTSGSVVRGSTRSKSKATQRDRLPFSVLREQWLKRWQCRFLFYEPVTSPDAAQFIGGRVTCASTESQAERFSNGPRPSATFLTNSAVVYPHFQACHPERSRGICCFFQPPPQPASNRAYRA